MARKQSDDLGFTPRRHQVAALASEGHTKREIAEELGISERTVKTHIEAICRVLGVKRQREIGRAYRHMMVTAGASEKAA